MMPGDQLGGLCLLSREVVVRWTWVTAAVRVRNSQFLEGILKVMRAGHVDGPSVCCNRKSGVKEDTQVFSLCNTKSPSPLPEMES